MREEDPEEISARWNRVFASAEARACLREILVILGWQGTIETEEQRVLHNAACLIMLHFSLKPIGERTFELDDLINAVIG